MNFLALRIERIHRLDFNFIAFTELLYSQWAVMNAAGHVGSFSAQAAPWGQFYNIYRAPSFSVGRHECGETCWIVFCSRRMT
jgi:hypothetical protein